ncbi:TrgA family protein [Salipiger abyssi]|uniref:Tellurite resistance protein TrgA n=1 Tax=Salipiger abyssi TaxID=1250539 RepID=A0A1P8UYJ0_9RHOB|nr:TrgA family protein [Salipiger abyssi]APZ54464.1 Tellurite resistance protein TrgA [Salipiger abyssi]
MFTAARLVAALCMLVLAYFGSQYIKTLPEESIDFGIFTPVNCVIGFLCGWIIVGPRAGRGTASAVSHGITGVAAMILWGLLVQSVNEMVRLAMRHRYDDPMEAFAAIFEIGIEFSYMLLDTGFFTMMLAGAIVTGLLSETASRNWR